VVAYYPSKCHTVPSIHTMDLTTLHDRGIYEDDDLAQNVSPIQ
jgi:hypothetical protein